MGKLWERDKVFVCDAQDEIYLSRREPKEDVIWSPERDSSAHSPAKEGEEEENEEGEKGNEKEEGDGEGDDKEDAEDDEDGGNEEMVGQVDGVGPMPFILPLIWTINDIYPTISLKVFNKLCNHFRIPKNIPIHLPKKFERCY